MELEKWKVWALQVVVVLFRQVVVVGQWQHQLRMRTGPSPCSWKPSMEILQAPVEVVAQGWVEPRGCGNPLLHAQPGRTTGTREVRTDTSVACGCTSAALLFGELLDSPRRTSGAVAAWLDKCRRHSEKQWKIIAKAKTTP